MEQKEREQKEREQMKMNCRKMASELGVFVCYTENEVKDE